jgi:glucose-1-phosphate adenylyltransferase
VGIRSRVGAGTNIKNSLLIGADHYETLAEINASMSRGIPPLGIGAESVIENAIIDKNARIGRGVRLVNSKGIKEKDGDGYFIREGLIIVPKNGVVADGVTV